MFMLEIFNNFGGLHGGNYPRIRKTTKKQNKDLFCHKMWAFFCETLLHMLPTTLEIYIWPLGKVWKNCKVSSIKKSLWSRLHLLIRNIREGTFLCIMPTSLKYFFLMMRKFYYTKKICLQWYFFNLYVQVTTCNAFWNTNINPKNS